jgi:hypothetical protein
MKIKQVGRKEDHMPRTVIYVSTPDPQIENINGAITAPAGNEHVFEYVVPVIDPDPDHQFKRLCVLPAPGPGFRTILDPGF